MPNLKNKNILDTVTKLVGKNNKLGKLLSGYGKLKEANYISAHFSSYLVFLAFGTLPFLSKPKL